MAVVLESTTGPVNRVSGSSLTIAYPSSIAADNLILAVAQGNSGNYNLGTSYGFTQLDFIQQNQSGVTREVEVWYKIAAGTESGNLTVTGPGNSFTITLFRFSNSTGSWDLAACENSAATATSHSITATANPGIEAGDYIIAAATIGGAANSANAGGASAEAITASGCTFINEVEFADGLNTTGGDHYYIISQHECDSGPASGAPTYSFNIVNTYPAMMMLTRIREAAAASFTPRRPLTGVGL